MPSPTYCRFCGASLKSPQARFCAACGRQLAASPSPTVGVLAPQLVVRVSGAAPRSVPLTKPTMTFGRAPDNDIVVAESYVSAHHGRFARRGGNWIYADLGSTNGTFVNGQRTEQAQLHPEDVLRIGDPLGNSVGLTLRAANAYEADVGSGTKMLGMEELGSAATVSIGRDPNSDITLPGAIVSRYHAQIEAGPKGRVLVDLNSTNGTFVNGERIAGRYPLDEGDVIQIGPFKLVYQAQSVQRYAQAGGVRLDGIGIVREVGHGAEARRILDGITLSIYPREFVALVGTSGAGKSTLMKVLSGVVRAEQGQVLVNRDDLYEQFDIYRTMIGYVPQDDILHQELVVADALRYSAKLRLPPDTTDEEIERRIDRVLEEVEMVAQRDQVISSLSGGQRKRVSIASELLAEPRLFFLDEPTSGLDPGLEKKMMYTLRRLADAGRTIVLVTHATANIAQCDHVCFLSQGRQAYYGPPEETFGFFEIGSGDFADVYDKLDNPDPSVARQQAESWRLRYEQSRQYQTCVAKRQQMLSEPLANEGGEIARSGPRVNPIRQLGVLTRRYLDLVLRDKLLLAVLLGVMPLTAALVLLVAGNNWLVGNTPTEIDRQLAGELANGATSATYAIVGDAQRLLFMMSLAAVQLGLFASVYEIVKEDSIYRRERMVTLRILPYIGSKIIVMGLFTLVQTLLYMIVIRLKVTYPTDGVLLPAPVEIYVTLMLSALASTMMGLLISAAVPNANTVLYVVFLALMSQMIFGGVMFELPGMSAEVSNLTLTRWSMEALGTSADMEGLGTMTRTRFQPAPATEVFSAEVARPSDDWVPVTVLTRTQEITIPVQPGVVQTVPISVPEVITHDLVTVTETVTETVTVEPEVMDIATETEFRLDYTRSSGHLVKSWMILLGYSILLGVATTFVLRSKDAL